MISFYANCAILNKIANLKEPKVINFGKKDTEMKKSCLISYK